MLVWCINYLICVSLMLCSGLISKYIVILNVQSNPRGLGWTLWWIGLDWVFLNPNIVDWIEKSLNSTHAHSYKRLWSRNELELDLKNIQYREHFWILLDLSYMVFLRFIWMLDPTIIFFFFFFGWITMNSINGTHDNVKGGDTT